MGASFGLVGVQCLQHREIVNDSSYLDVQTSRSRFLFVVKGPKYPRPSVRNPSSEIRELQFLLNWSYSGKHLATCSYISHSLLFRAEIVGGILRSQQIPWNILRTKRNGEILSLTNFGEISKVEQNYDIPDLFLLVKSTEIKILWLRSTWISNYASTSESPAGVDEQQIHL